MIRKMKRLAEASIKKCGAELLLKLCKTQAGLHLDLLPPSSGLAAALSGASQSECLLLMHCPPSRQKVGRATCCSSQPGGSWESLPSPSTYTTLDGTSQKEFWAVAFCSGHQCNQPELKILWKRGMWRKHQPRPWKVSLEYFLSGPRKRIIVRPPA